MALDSPRVSPQVLFRGAGWHANMTQPFMGPGAIKQAETNLQQKTEYIIFRTTSQENKQQMKRKVLFT